MSCVHCGLCLQSCPTYTELGTEADSPRGRILLLRALEEGKIDPTEDVIGHLDSCLGCRACEPACPSGVPYGSLIEAARPFLEKHRSPPARLARSTLDAMLTRAPLRNALAAPLGLVAGKPWAAKLARATSSSLLAYAAALPARRKTPRSPQRLDPEGAHRGTALLLTGCVAETSFPETAVAIGRLLTQAGVRVLLPSKPTCCGALSMHLGQEERARELGRDLTESSYDGSIQWYVPTASGCGAHLRGYEELLDEDPRAGEIASRTRDPLELLAELGLPPAKSPIAETVAIHDPCHLVHAQGVKEAPRRLLAEIPEMEFVDLPEAEYCCGSAGTYNLTERPLAKRLLERKLDAIESTGARIIAAANPGCLLQIRAGAILRGLPLEIVHPVELLARSQNLLD